MRSIREARMVVVFRSSLPFLVMTAIALSVGIAVGLLGGDKAFVFAQEEITPTPGVLSVVVTSTGGGEAVVTPRASTGTTRTNTV